MACNARCDGVPKTGKGGLRHVFVANNVVILAEQLVMGKACNVIQGTIRVCDNPPWGLWLIPVLGEPVEECHGL